MWDYDTYTYYGGERLMKDLFDDGYVDHAIFQPALLSDFYNNGLRPDRGSVRAHPTAPRQADLQPRLRPPQRARPASISCVDDAERMDLQGRQALHRRVARRLPRLQARRPLVTALPRRVHQAGYQEHPRAQGPHDPAAGPRCLRRRRHRQGGHRLPRPELRRRARRAYPGWRTSAGSPPRSPTSTVASRWRFPFIHTRPRYFAQIIGELLYWIGEDKILFSSDYALWTPEVADREVRRLPDSRGHAGRVRPDHRRSEAKDPGTQRRRAVRHRRPSRTSAARSRPVRAVPRWQRGPRRACRS